jgi:biotin transport system substrate-specific component
MAPFVDGMARRVECALRASYEPRIYDGRRPRIHLKTGQTMAAGASSVRVSSTLVASLWPAHRGGAIRGAVLVLLAAGLLTVSAKLQVPFWPVPMTMQTMVVLMIGAAMGSRLGAAAVIVYLVEGAIGLPVFAGTPERGLGLPYMAGPTGGFLVGFLAATVVTGCLAEQGFGRTLPRLLVAMTIGHLVIFAFGLAWLSVHLGAAQAWAVGAAPFVAGTLVKTLLAAALIQAGWLVSRR